MGASVQSFNIKPNSKWLEKCPHFLNEIPEWHTKLFKDSEKIYEPHPEQFLKDTLQSIRQVSRSMSVYRLLLLLFPYPKLVGRRNQFKNTITDAIRHNGFKVKDYRGNIVSADAFFSLEYFHDCAYVYVDLEGLEDAARRGWLYSEGLYVCVWRRYVEEKEACFQQNFEEFESQQQSKGGVGSAELGLLNDVSVRPENLALQESLVPNLVEALTESEEKACKPFAQEQIDRWCAKVENYYSPVGKCKFHINICRKIASEEGFEHSAEYIANETRGAYQKLKVVKAE